MSKASKYADAYQAHSHQVSGQIKAAVGTDTRLLLTSTDQRLFVALSSEEALALGKWLIDMYGEPV